MGGLGAFLGQLAGKAQDPIFWPFAVGFLIFGLRHKILLAVALGIAAAAVNAVLSWNWWTQIAPDATAFNHLVFVVSRSWIVWSIILGGFGYLIAFASGRVRRQRE